MGKELELFIQRQQEMIEAHREQMRRLREPKPQDLPVKIDSPIRRFQRSGRIYDREIS